MQQPIILDGRVLAREIEAELRIRVERLRVAGQIPSLATILVGDNPSSRTYVKMKRNACARIGLMSASIELPETTTTAELLEKIKGLNEDSTICGILLQHPLPRQIDEQVCFNAISLAKDVDGVNTGSFGAMTMQMDGFKSATPLAIMTILKRYQIKLAGLNAVVIGRSPILGKPVAMMLLNANATVTICHSQTRDLPSIVKNADLLVAAIGKAKFVQGDWVKDGAILIDAGYNEGNIGDIDLDAAAPKSSAYTPVPGGVGPVTIACLLTQAVEAAEKLCKFNLF